MPENHIPSKADIERLRASNEELTRQVAALAQRDDDKTQALRNTRIVLALVALMMVAGGVITWRIFDKFHDDAYSRCESSNERLGVQRALWAGVLNAEDPAHPRSEKEQALVDRVVDYANAGFANYNCDDLGQKFEAPKFPHLDFGE